MRSTLFLSLAGLVALAALFTAQPAEAGRRPFLWAYDTETVPEGDVELEQWLWARSRTPATPTEYAEYWIWWAPVIGLTDHLELAVPFQVRARATETALESFEADVRYRIFPREDEGGYQPLIRVAYHQPIHWSETTNRLDVDWVNTFGRPDEVHFDLDLGVRWSLPAIQGLSSPSSVLGTYDAACSVPLGHGLKIAAELFGRYGLLSDSTWHHFVGLALSWTRGRFWATAGTMIGLTPLAPNTPQFMPRLMWAVAL